MGKRFRLVVVLAAVAMLTAVSTAVPVSASDDLRPIRSLRSLTGIHEWYEQTHQGYPVLGSFYGRHMDTNGKVVAINDGRLAVSGAVSAPRISEDEAKSAAGEGQLLARLYVLPGVAQLVWATSSIDGYRTLVDANDGNVVRRDREARDANGTGKVFDPNPVAKLQNQTLTDSRDADYAALQPAYVTRTLTNLDGSGFLRGDYADVVGRTRRGEGNRAFSATLTWTGGRKDFRFEEVVTYYAVTAAQTYIQSLGFTSINNEPQDVSVNTLTADESFYSPSLDLITLGAGGVDDGEDSDITWHELGHAIQDAQVPSYGIGHDANAIGEAFGDYWAVTMSVPVNGGYQVPCVADWDATSYTSTQPHCLRRTDLNLTLADQNGFIHHDGQIWSRALWDTQLDLGRTVADQIILEAQFSFSPDTTFQQAAGNTVTAAQNLFGAGAAATVQQNFLDRGIVPA